MNFTKVLKSYSLKCFYSENYMSTLIKCSFSSKGAVIQQNPNELVPVEENFACDTAQSEDETSLLKNCNEDISLYAPYLKPTFNLAAYIDKSPILQNLVDLGVNLHHIEKKNNACDLILKLDLDHLNKYLLFLKDTGLDVDQLGDFITKNPFIFNEELDNLQTRINYLECKKFDKDMITRIITKNPYWLMFSTEKIDKRLGYFQKKFKLSGNEVRHITIRQPKLITYKLNHIDTNTFTIKEEMGFTEDEMKKLLLNKPRLWMMNKDSILDRFLHAHREMNLSNEYISLQPEILLCRKHKAKERHQFLKKLGRDQYNPLKPNYVPMLELVSGNDAEFCEKVAKSSVLAFNMFIKSM